MSGTVTEGELAEAARLVERHFGYGELRPGQAEVLARVLRGDSVLAVLPTGGGKSVLYQLPGLVGKGITVVVSPLIALMKDQLDNLPAPMRAAAVSVTSELSGREIEQVTQEIAEGRYRLVYAAPERLRQTPFREALRRGGIARLVVDEAHCVSLWGHDFRPDYLALGEMRRALGDPPVMAVTATAPPHVREDIQKRLGPLTEVVVPIRRPNLRFEAITAADADEKLAHLVHLVKEEPGSTIVYASSRSKCETLAAALQREGVAADFYHAGLDDRGRARSQELFMRGVTRVLVATVAFGMGIDKEDVRLLVHVDPPSSLEAYFQEAGRAGRDRRPARCVLLTTSGDASFAMQRARRDLPDDKVIGRVRMLVGACRHDSGYALVPTDELDQLDKDPVRPRVALSLLAAAGVVSRLGDAPRILQIDGGRGQLAALSGEPVSVFDLAGLLDVDPQEVEPMLFRRATAGEFRLGMGQRDLLLKVEDADAPVADVLAAYRRRAEESAREVLDYAKHDGCRHAYISRHFGDDTDDRCDACDNCLGIKHHLPAEARPDDGRDALAVLQALNHVKGIGLTNLAYVLRGDPMAPPWTDDNPARGKLASRSAAKIKNMVRQLAARGLVDTETLGHGGQTFRITPGGRAALGMGRVNVVDVKGARAATKKQRASAKTATPVGVVDDALLEALKEWRREAAAKEGVPAYVVAHDRTLKSVAAAAPATKDALLAINGMGPKKVEKYGDDILAVVRARGT